jgi:dihydropyrimidine dehydrogenase (NAD+) subunit PreA
MKDLSIDFAGVRSPNPFWLASAPPTNTGDQISRAFDMGWGGAVWKTLGTPIVNVSSRLGGIVHRGRRLAGLNNIELITDRDLDTNFREIKEVKRRHPENLVIVSLMVETPDEWKMMVERSIEAGGDLLELNFGCPHGMCERGMGSAVGQQPKVLEVITGWVKEYSTIPVITKLTPNISDIRVPGLAAVRSGADAVSLINTIKSIVSVDLERLVPLPRVEARGTSGGFCGPAVKPIAMHMVWQLARHPEFTIPISGIGGIATWRDAVEFILLGASTTQVCTAVMHYGYRIVESMAEGLSDFMEEKGYDTVADMVGKALPQTSDWGDLNLNYQVRAEIDRDRCIGCQLCYPACRDGGHHAIRLPGTTEFAKLAGEVDPNWDGRQARIPVVDWDACVGCNLCSLICPVESIAMRELDTGRPPQSWNEFQATGKRI